MLGDLQKFHRGRHHGGCASGGRHCRAVEVCANPRFCQGDKYETEGHDERAQVAKKYTRNVCSRDRRHEENRSERGNQERMRGASGRRVREVSETVLMKHRVTRE